MANFLTTTSISAELESLIKTAREEITLISPYLKVNQRLQDFIRDADMRRVRLTVIYGKRDIQDAEWEWLNKLTNSAETWFVPNLHAKCYLSENAAIITSMNLYEFSQQNNDEMGIYVSKEEDPDLYQQIKEEAQRLRRTATRGQAASTAAPQPATTTAPRPATTTAPQPATAAAPQPATAAAPQPATAARPPAAANRGQPSSPLAYCIRCQVSVPHNSEKPYCDQHYRIWARYGDMTYEEKFCHKCGKENTTSMAKPLCLPCFRRG